MMRVRETCDGTVIALITPDERQAEIVKALRAVHAVAEASGLTVGCLLGTAGNRGIADWRHVAMWLACRESGLAAEAVGALFGRSGALVYHARRKVAEAVDRALLDKARQAEAALAGKGVAA